MIDELLTRHAPDADDMEDISRELRGSVLARARLDTGRDPLSPRRQVAAWLVPTSLALAAAVAATVLVVSPGTLRGDAGPAAESTSAAPTESTPAKQLIDSQRERAVGPLEPGQVRYLVVEGVVDRPAAPYTVRSEAWMTWDDATYCRMTDDAAITYPGAPADAKKQVWTAAPMLDAENPLPPAYQAALPSDPRALVEAIEKSRARWPYGSNSFSLIGLSNLVQKVGVTGPDLLGMLVDGTAPGDVLAAAVEALVDLQGARVTSVDNGSALRLTWVDDRDARIEMTFDSASGQVTGYFETTQQTTDDGQQETVESAATVVELKTVAAVPSDVVEAAKRQAVVDAEDRRLHPATGH